MRVESCIAHREIFGNGIDKHRSPLPTVWCSLDDVSDVVNTPAAPQSAATAGHIHATDLQLPRPGVLSLTSSLLWVSDLGITTAWSDLWWWPRFYATKWSVRRLTAQSMKKAKRSRKYDDHRSNMLILTNFFCVRSVIPVTLVVFLCW